jgi:hypothetical protein
MVVRVKWGEKGYRWMEYRTKRVVSNQAVGVNATTLKLLDSPEEEPPEMVGCVGRPLNIGISLFRGILSGSPQGLWLKAISLCPLTTR